MAITIIAIDPSKPDLPLDPILAHIAIKNFKWTSDSTSEGISSQDAMFDWVVNKKGKAYVRTDILLPVFGAVSPDGKQYLRCVRESKWSDDLINLPKI